MFSTKELRMAQKKGNIPLDYVINITTSVIKDPYKLAKLPTLLITKYDAKNPMNKWMQYSDLASIGLHYSMGSTVYNFAYNYFGFVSKLSKRAELLHVYTYNSAQTYAVLKGNVASSLEELKKLNGKFQLVVNQETKDITIDLTSSTSHTDIATKLQVAIRQGNNNAPWKDIKVTYHSTPYGHFQIELDKANDATIMPLITPSSGTDASYGLGLRQDEGAFVIAPEPLLDSLEKVYKEIQQVNDSYYVITFDFEFETASLKTELTNLGRWVASTNNRYLALYTTTAKEPTTQYNWGDSYHEYEGLMIDRFDTLTPLGYTAGLISSLDLSTPGGNIALDKNDGSKFINEAVLEYQHLRNLNKNRVNSFALFGQLGQSVVWYGPGDIMGTQYRNANVYIGNSYIMFLIQFSFANMFSKETIIGLSDEPLVNSYLTIALTTAVNAGLIVKGDKLTESDLNTLRNRFKSNAEKAVVSIQNIGYYYELGDFNRKTQCLGITYAYVANLPIKCIMINSYLLGA